MYYQLSNPASKSGYKDEFLGEVEDTSISRNEEDSSVCSTPFVQRTPKASLIKKTSPVVNALNKLLLIQEQDDLLHFTLLPGAGKTLFKCHHNDCSFFENSRSDENKGQESSHNNCNKSESKEKNRELQAYGPFLSCSVRHGRSEDFDNFSEFNFPIEKNPVPVVRDHSSLLYGRPSSAPARPQSVQFQTDLTRTATRCCPLQFSLFIDYYEEYKLKVTYGKIPKFHQKRIKDRYKAWIAFENLNNSSKPGSANQMQNTRPSSRMTVRPSRLADPAFNSTHGSKFNYNYKSNEMMYGPSAIASVSGYSYKSIHAAPPTPNFDYPKMRTSSIMPTKIEKVPNCQSEIIIPWPSDNVRYYDDDSHPRITDLLVNSPFEKPEDVSITLKNVHRSNSSEVVTQAPPILNPSLCTQKLEYIVGSGRTTKASFSKKLIIDKDKLLSKTTNTSRSSGDTFQESSYLNSSKQQLRGWGDSIPSSRSNVETSFTKTSNQMDKISTDQKIISTKTKNTRMSGQPKELHKTLTHTVNSNKVMGPTKKISILTRRFKENISLMPLKPPRSKYKNTM